MEVQRLPLLLSWAYLGGVLDEVPVEDPEVLEGSPVDGALLHSVFLSSVIRFHADF